MAEKVKIETELNLEKAKKMYEELNITLERLINKEFPAARKKYDETQQEVERAEKNLKDMQCSIIMC